MMRTVLVLSLFVAACGGSSVQPATAASAETEPDSSTSGSGSNATPSDVPYSVEEPPKPTAGTASQDEAWWLKGSCPKGSERFGAAPPAGMEIGCRTPKGKLEGRFATFYDNGKKAEEGEYHDNLAVGIWTAWFADGKKQLETSYEAGEKSGLETEWYPSGNIKSQREYKAGKREGLTTIWDEAGQKRTAMTYKNAKPHGKEVRWDESGKVAKVIDHGSN
jgi:hypothetical protein